VLFLTCMLGLRRIRADGRLHVDAVLPGPSGWSRTASRLWGGGST
jgi:hypothetical protein